MVHKSIFKKLARNLVLIRRGKK